jgi:Flp pilus assembly protein TadG
MLRDRSGAAAAEFALVLPLLLILMFGIVDAGRFLWAVNIAQKATQAGARVAVVTNPVSSGFVSVDYVGVDGLKQGDRIPASEFPTITCTSSTCAGGAFDLIVARMHALDNDITPANVVVTYRGSGIGYAGDPNGSQVQPLVTVTAQSLPFVPITTLLFVEWSLPDFSTTLTAEDLSGIASN